ncbi:HNH endonuclease signature motif containing protein, partial [Arthrobacter sp. S39]|uniref:HNH endonuclease signature motif containing protein n=1 Tax=Arthrobacter sp. S39 TaxID=2509720 RepID=UPI001F5FABBF
SLDNEADHLRPWHQGGTTGVSNLGNPCPRHHRLRHTSGWRPTPATKNEPPGWISPSGRHYTSEHQDWEPPHLPKELQPEVAATPTSNVAATEHGPPPTSRDKFCRPDFAHTGLSLGEDGLERFLHAHA